uniref:PSI-J n=1 Tax=Haptolina ericina TaxID=156174 RepID=A0A7S3BY20_9EUKA
MMKLGLVLLVAHSAALDVVRSRGAPPGQRVTASSLEDLTAVRPGSCSQHSRRRLVSCAVPIGLFITSRTAAAFAADELPAEATFLVPTPLGIISYGLKKQSQRQEACYDAGECVDKVPYYQIECGRGDSACSERKRRLAKKEIGLFFSDPGASPALLVFSLFLLGGPFAGVTRATITVLRQLMKKPP